MNVMRLAFLLPLKGIIWPELLIMNSNNIPNFETKLTIRFEYELNELNEFQFYSRKIE